MLSFRQVCRPVHKKLARQSLSLSLLVLMTFAFSRAHAEIFTCTSLDQFEQIIVHYGPAKPNDDAGPRAFMMTVNDLSLSQNRQFVARFHSSDGGLNNSDGLVIGHVDLNHPESNQKGKRIGGTRLGLLSAIYLDIDFSFREPLEDGGRYSAQVVYLKKNGEELLQEFDCIRDSALEEQFAKSAAQPSVQTSGQ